MALMQYSSEKLELKEKINGFNERDVHSKAILCNDKDGLLSYKIQRTKTKIFNETVSDMHKMKSEIFSLKGDLEDIKKLLSAIVNTQQGNAK